MSRAPSMPTPKQIREAVTVMRELHPEARVVGIGPDGVQFDYPDQSKPPSQKWQGMDFDAA